MLSGADPRSFASAFHDREIFKCKVLGYEKRTMPPNISTPGRSPPSKFTSANEKFSRIRRDKIDLSRFVTKSLAHPRSSFSLPSVQTKRLDNPQCGFRFLLQQEFLRRCKKNERYSLRSFAKSLGIEASPLSAMLRGRRPVTSKMVVRLGTALGMSLEEVYEIQSRVATPEQRIALDEYAVISDWYHYAILELIRVRSFKPDLGYVARALSITKTEANIAVERLQRIGLLRTSADGAWIDASQNGFATNINGGLTSEASKKLQRQVLELSIAALESAPIDERNHTSMTFAVDPADLAEAAKRIQKFRREICAFFERSAAPSRVYHLSVSLYPVSKEEPTNEV